MCTVYFSKAFVHKGLKMLALTPANMGRAWQRDSIMGQNWAFYLGKIRFGSTFSKKTLKTIVFLKLNTKILAYLTKIYLDTKNKAPRYSE